MRTTLPFLGLAAVLLAALPAGRAAAQNARSYVSATGGGTACTLTAPCASLQFAHDATNGRGEVYCLDPGASPGGQRLIITKSITIDCRGGSMADIQVTGSRISVLLRNVTVNAIVEGSGPGIGVDFQNGAALILENCVIEKWDSSSLGAGPGVGVRFAPPDGVTAKLHVTDSLIRENGLPTSGGGIIIQPSGSGSARVVIERSRIENNTFGIFANGTGSTGVISVQVRDSVVSNSKFSGISSFTSAGHSVASITVDHSSSVLSGANGILSQGPNAFVFLTESTVMANVVGLNAASSGAIFSYQNNRLTGNVTDGAPTNVLTVR
jgi:hypothetical protein